MPPPGVTTEAIERNLASGAWQDRTLVDVVREHATQAPDRLAVADQHERLTYAQLLARAGSLAAWLVDRGLEPGDVVALQSPNRTALPVVHLACDMADLLCLPLSDAWRRTELEHLLGQARARIAIVPAPQKGVDFLELLGSMRAGLPSLDAVGALEGAGGDFDYEDVVTTGQDAPSVDRDPNEPRFVMVSSGTTDLPTMSQWTDNNLWFFLRQFGEHVGMAAGELAVGLAPANTGATGYVFPVLAPLLHGGSSVLLEHWAPREALDLLEAEGAQLATAIPTQIVKMLQDDTVRERDWSRLEVFNNAGAPLARSAAEELEEVFECTVQAVYGATDGGVPVMTSIEDPPEKRYATVGSVLPHTRIRLVDANRAEVQPGQAGEILWSNPTKSYGYFNDEDRTASVWTDDGMYVSGDLGQVDEDGYVSIVGRAKDMVIRGGQNISPGEIEEALVTHPAVSEVAVIGIPDKVYGERVCACVSVREGETLDFDAMVAHLAAQEMAKFKLPERLELFDDLPRSAGAKLNKVALREMVAERMDGDDA